MFKFLLFVTGLFIFIGISLIQQSSLPDHNIFISGKVNLYDEIKTDKSFENPTIFFIFSLIPQLRNQINKGEYSVAKGEYLYSVMIKMLTGDTVTRKITFPEGYTVRMIVEKLNNESNLSGEIKEIPEEGSLFPSTYFYKKNDAKQSIIDKMQTQMDIVIKQLFHTQNKEEIKKIIILASIIEKESKNSNERSLIASVFYNRLAKGMRLQSDPTVIYGISNGYGKIDRLLTRKDLWHKSQYNTYRNNGLPPTPICCPSKESLAAALNPTKTDFLYFVATASNEAHIFTKEYREHLQNIKLRKINN